ncbi:MAG TPA: limonene-1,2-epoxide hydrolase family protein [Acidimicrobiales bacterium]
MNSAEVVTTFIRALERSDLDAALELVTEDVEYDNVPMLKVVGAQAIRDVLGPFLSAFQSIEWVVHHQVAEGELVMNERLDRFQRPDGSWLELPVAGLFVVRDGRIALWRDYFDLGGFQRQMGGS